MRPPAGASVAVFGTGTVGMASIMAATVAGATTIIGVDLSPARLDLARELGATHTVHVGDQDPVEQIKAITGSGADFTIEATGLASMLRQAVDASAPTGVTTIIGAPALGTEVSLDINEMLIFGRTVRGIVEGDSVPDVFIPRLIQLWRQGRFPVDRLMRNYDLDQLDEAAHDAEQGRVIKAVVRM